MFIGANARAGACCPTLRRAAAGVWPLSADDIKQVARATRRQGVRHSTHPTHEASTRYDHPTTRDARPEHLQPVPLTIGALRLLRWQVSLIRQLQCPGERGSGRSAAARRRLSPDCMPWPRRAAARMHGLRSRDLVARRPARCRRLHLLDLPAARVRVVRRGCACLVAVFMRASHGPHAPTEFA